MPSVTLNESDGEHSRKLRVGTNGTTQRRIEDASDHDLPVAGSCNFDFAIFFNGMLPLSLIPCMRFLFFSSPPRYPSRLANLCSRKRRRSIQSETSLSGTAMSARGRLSPSRLRITRPRVEDAEMLRYRRLTEVERFHEL